MLKTNKDKLVKMAVQGSIAPPATGPYRITTEGKALTLPGTGGITYNVRLGSSAMGWVADHVEPGVSIKEKDERDNSGLQTFACIGNTARVISGDAKKKKGVVIGKHGGIEHVLVDFKDEAMYKMAMGDKILVDSFGTGLSLEDYPNIKIRNIDPDLFEKLDIKEKDEGIEVPVTTTIPPYLMGSGIGANTSHRGDYDIMTHDPEAYKKHNLDELKIGDLVLLEDCDNEYGRGYLKGAVTIGVIIHSDCVVTGHGPGVTTIMTSKKPVIKGRIDKNANISNYIEFEEDDENEDNDNDKNNSKENNKENKDD
ncbi:DUF4438 domain-containing protein [Natranaerofaba carboxydovora]|uniref:DUF4438 domain-containing protein n=1 Tax=Natranaerofaba carboxydovora TaxID=2742683 RepID=UPI001F143D94|nr:DUF4438 domain-containing protein [Natranaerofaba carboxydovora]UMZ75026.1 hypothetical protein ACONDI_02637 [Natranaerofaba carboxydovora]